MKNGCPLWVLLLFNVKSLCTEAYSHASWRNLNPSSVESARRKFFSVILGSSIAFPQRGLAAQVEQEKSAPKFRISSSQIIQFLENIPTFTIVDKSGTPYMVVGEDANPVAYFFTTYNEAQRILKLANESAIQTMNELRKQEISKRRAAGEKPFSKGEMDELVGVNPWSSENARISTVPLSFAVTLASKGKIKGAFFRVSPAEEDVVDALALDTTKNDLPEGKVPLFYFENFEIEIPGESGQVQIPIYFLKSQLLNEWQKSNPGKEPPPVKVTELFSLLTSMVDSKAPFNEDLEKLKLIPPPDSAVKAKLCMRKGGKSEPFKMGERIIVL